MPKSYARTVVIDSRELKAAFRGAFPGQRAVDLATNWAMFWGLVLQKAQSAELVPDTPTPVPAPSPTDADVDYVKP